MSKNDERAAQTKSRLIAAARQHFARDGYAQTATESILEDAGVKRGAMYHHFRDKADLFEAVCRQLTAEAGAAVEKATDGETDTFAALERGSVAWIDFMSQPESRRILVCDAPGVLGRERWESLDRELSFDLLLAGLNEALEAGVIRFDAGANALAVVLNGAMNQIALRSEGNDLPDLTAAFVEMLRRLRA